MSSERFRFGFLLLSRLRFVRFFFLSLRLDLLREDSEELRVFVFVCLVRFDLDLERLLLERLELDREESSRRFRLESFLFFAGTDFESEDSESFRLMRLSLKLSSTGCASFSSAGCWMSSRSSLISSSLFASARAGKRLARMSLGRSLGMNSGPPGKSLLSADLWAFWSPVLKSSSLLSRCLFLKM